MGSTVSKQRTLQKASQVVKPATLVKPKPVRPDGGDPDAAAHQQLLNRLSHMAPQAVAHAAPHHSYQPSTKDQMSTMLRARSAAEDRDAELAKGPHKTKVPEQTLSAIVSMLQRGETREDIVRAFQIDPSLIGKLEHLKIPKAPGPVGGVGIRR